MSLPNIDLVRKLVETGRAQDILDLLEGESEYTSPEYWSFSLIGEHGRAYMMAIHYLRFVAEFGLAREVMIEDGNVRRAYPDDFDHWLQLGAPGIIANEFNDYLKAKPW